MIDANELTNKLSDNTDLIIMILVSLGHKDCRDRGSYIQCSNLDGDNRSAISILKDKLLYQNFTRGRKGNIFTLVMDEKNISFPNAVDYVANIIGYKGTKTKISYPFHGFYHNISKFSKPTNNIKIYPATALPPANNLSQYWFKEGVNYQVQERYGIRLDLETNRVIIPIHDNRGELVGAKARYNGMCDTNDRWSMYLPYAKSLVVYGLYENSEKIMKSGKAFIVEAEKSVCQAASWGNDILLAVGGHDISLAQAELIKSLGVDVVIGFDQGIMQADVIEQAEKCLIHNDLFKNHIGFIDMSKMPYKSSPTDLGRTVFDNLNNNKIIWIGGIDGN